MSRVFHGLAVLFGAWAVFDLVMLVLQPNPLFWLVTAVVTAGSAAVIWVSAGNIARSERSIRESRGRIDEMTRRYP